MSQPKYPDVTILLQGLLSPGIDIRELLNRYLQYCPIKLSIYTYQEDDIKEILKEFPHITYIVNDQTEFENELRSLEIPKVTQTDECHNSYFQISSILSCIKNIHTPYTLFCRIDHLYSNLDLLIEFGRKNPFFITTSMFTRGAFRQHWRFHFSDCLFFGNTEKLLEVFTLAKKEYTLLNITFRPNECRVWRPYFEKKFIEEGRDYLQCSYEDYLRIIMKHMVIVPVSALSPFKINLSKKIMTENSFPPESQTSAFYILNGSQVL